MGILHHGILEFLWLLSKCYYIELRVPLVSWGAGATVRGSPGHRLCPRWWCGIPCLFVDLMQCSRDRLAEE